MTPSVSRRLAAAAALLFALASLVGCNAHNPEQGDTGDWVGTGYGDKTSKGDKFREQRVARPIRDLLQRLDKEGIDRASAPQEDLSRFSNPLVRIRDDGRIQANVRTVSLDLDLLETLTRHDVLIEHIDRERGVVQAWIPFDQVKDVARLKGIELLDVPSYGRPR